MALSVRNAAYRLNISLHGVYTLPVVQPHRPAVQPGTKCNRTVSDSSG